MKTRTKVLLIAIPVIIVGIWFAWMSYDSSKSDFIENKLTNTIGNVVKSQLLSADRELYSINGASFYTPVLNNADQSSEVYKSILTQLNQDASLPPLKIKYFSIIQDTKVYTTGTVYYTELFGIPKSLRFHVTTDLIPFKNKEGTELNTNTK